ncbi:MAG: hypothetical protein ACD_38C00086G0018 [uncultured bacterium]|uniref:Peptidase M24 n=1 Tax=Candidatus Daviesbacteria bacterium GW2011_GWC2_40_12 TaxID=1618431 RepID=A0A0G0TVU3_9BACT|nr:MAG: hypothetical protein ACD_38C00086G0018 [uncultured bacterium]KKQ83896.1 MAG: Peptidase M24 [Candidatus Daviesbacteria bacterium GW2011_GWF2_38_7]KKR16983.1 MAG: Peptidase M24 [Candidatus Daviesbacteria bacterium GW2011_GWA2_39_33]KKR25428.1 MAG: Peptidase M24 [Candidatus Daviesbacteria bacterium GW2011_GWB1_39_5]KKR42047.1 MAG: Peptidase M24 [Candidatus Daviesbacteria bacterium GW2011_GWC2_40_12]OGE20815.1 MAG: hypothetical protein A2778_06105 [Candidatus Daviesbacteria bacterium RIFCS
MFKQRIQQVKQKISKAKLDAIWICDVSNITYLTGFSNFSKEEREAYLLIGKDFQFIITDARYSEAVRKEIPHLKLFERSHQNPTEKLFESLKNKIKVLGIEEDELTVLEYKSLKKHFKKTKHFNLKTNRLIKTPEEIKKIEKACKLGDLAFKYILKKIRTGISEKELAYELEKFIKENGAELSFPSIVAFGKNSSVPHHQTGNTKLEEKHGQFVLLDFGVKLENYCSDMTRTVFFGKPSKEQQKIYETVLSAQQKAVDYINKTLKSGKKIWASKVDIAARDYIISKGFPTIPHSLGHGIGLEVHEHPSLSPKSKEDLKSGMVFSIEPGIYIPNLGGVRIEDLFVLENQQLRALTGSSKALIII